MSDQQIDATVSYVNASDCTVTLLISCSHAQKHNQHSQPPDRCVKPNSITSINELQLMNDRI